MGAMDEVSVTVVRERIVKPDLAALKLAIEAAGLVVNSAAAALTDVEVEATIAATDMYLSPIDVMFRYFQHNRRVLFFDRPPDSLNYNDLVDSLASSLSSALASFFPFSGRLSGQHRFLRLTNIAAGASLTEAVVKGVTIDRLRRLSFPTLPAFRGLAPSFPPELYDSVPLFAAQISRFDCGGIALGISHSHVICDGTSLWHFMTSWAECARGEPISIPPIHARTLLKIDNPSLEKAKIDLEYVDDEDRGNNQESDVKLNTFQFAKEMVQQLKKKVKGGLTSYEVICGHTWKQTTKAREQERNKKVGFISIVNMRKRFEPPLGYAYFGNANMWTIATATVGELEDEDLNRTCRRIRSSIASCTSDTFRDWLQWLEIHDRGEILKCAALNGARLRASSSHNFPIFKVDFGWGKPCAVRCPNAEDIGKIVFFPSNDTIGDVDMVLALPTKVMHRLEIDDTFTNP